MHTNIGNKHINSLQIHYKYEYLIFAVYAVKLMQTAVYEVFADTATFVRRSESRKVALCIALSLIISLSLAFR